MLEFWVYKFEFGANRHRPHQFIVGGPRCAGLAANTTVCKVQLLVHVLVRLEYLIFLNIEVEHL